MKTSIILPCYIPDLDVAAYCERFFDTLFKYESRENFQLVIVDNGSIDKLPLEYMADIYIRKDHPIGYARAVNLGMAIADGDRLVVVNNDIEFEHPWLSILNHQYDDIGGLLSVQDIPYERNSYYPDESWYSAWMIDRATWQKVGYLDEFLNYRFHDQDYSIRLKKAGFNIGRTGLVHVKHGNSITYNKMGRDEDPAERDEMIRRHGHSLFSEWVRAQYRP